MTPELLAAYNTPARVVPRLDSERNPNRFFHLNLPPDYESLTISGKKRARLNGVCLQGTPRQFVRAWNLFRTYYFLQLPPGSFYKDFRPSGKLHFDIVEDIAKYQLNAWAAPRGYAKSTVLGTEIPLLLTLTRPNFDILLILALIDKVVKRFTRFMLTFMENPYILEDFGRLQPPLRGSARVWNHGNLQLMNGSALAGMSVDAKLLGERPDLLLADDPEHDDATVLTPNPSALRDAYEKLLFGTLMPMLRKGTGMGWIGTLLDPQSFLYHIMHGNDPRFSFWNRRLVGAETGGVLQWEAKDTREDLDQLRKMWGEEYFQTHMMNRPGVRQDRIFTIHPEYCTYTVDSEDEALETDPMNSTADLVTIRPVRTDSPGVYDEQKIIRPFGATVREMYRLLTVDFAYTVSARSDYSAIHVSGFENSELFKDTLWSLDLWVGKRPISEVVDKVLELAYLWKVRMIAAEAVATQNAFADQIRSEAERRAKWEGWSPLIHPGIKYPSNTKKEQRISGMEWRFRKFRVKLPRQRRLEWPYKELFFEIENFSPHGRSLPHDDAIDCMAMYQHIGRPRSRSHLADAGEAGNIRPAEHLARGELYDPCGISWMSACDPNQIPVNELRDLQREKQMEEGSDLVTWREGGF